MPDTEASKKPYYFLEREAETYKAKAELCDLEITRLTALKDAYYDMAQSLRHAIDQQRDADVIKKSGRGIILPERNPEGPLEGTYT